MYDFYWNKTCQKYCEWELDWYIKSKVDIIVFR